MTRSTVTTQATVSTQQTISAMVMMTVVMGLMNQPTAVSHSSVYLLSSTQCPNSKCTRQHAWKWKKCNISKTV